MLPTVPETLAQSAEKYPTDEALVYPEAGIRLEYAELDARATRFANVLRELGVSKGDTVSVMSHNSVPMVVSVYGIPRAGGVFSPVNYRLAPDEAAYIFDDSGAEVVCFDESVRGTVGNVREELTADRFVYFDDDSNPVPEYAVGFHELLGDAVETPPAVSNDPGDVWAIMYTSGTTGRPKGVVHTHENATYHNMVMMGGMSRNRVGIIMMPLYHNAALNCSLLPGVNVGGKSVVLSGFDPEQALELVDEELVTSMSLPSRTWQQVLDSKEESDFEGESLESIGYGTSDMPPPLLEDLIDTFGEVVSTAYGMTEMGPVAVAIEPEDIVEKLGSVGVALPNHDARIVEPTSTEDPNDPVTPADTVPPGEEGEIILAGPCMMEGYLNRPEKTADAVREGWFFTGDLGYKDEDGFIYLVDRVDDMIISGGENIYPTEVEAVLYESDLVADAGVVGIDDDQWGEAVTAYVVPSEGTDPEGLEEKLDQYCLDSEQLAEFKRPRRYVFVDELPKNPSGKIQRYKLRDRTES
jgi:fatty-acyl-CoA synthase